MSRVRVSEESRDRALPGAHDLQALFRRHHGEPDEHGWRVRMRHRFGYYAPDQWYEAAVDRLVTPGCRWLDVGGGKSVFPENPALSLELAGRCSLLVGIDPSDNILGNRLVHRRVQSRIEDFHPGETFDLATLRMVAEHVAEPRLVIEALRELLRPGGHVIIYTPNRWSPMTLAAMTIPDAWHAHLTRLVDAREEEDVFPTLYRMNTRRQLRRLFEEGNFTEVAFAYLDNCRTLQRFRPTCFAELCAWRGLRRLGLRYPESDLLGVYRRQSAV